MEDDVKMLLKIPKKDHFYRRDDAARAILVLHFFLHVGMYDACSPCFLDNLFNLVYVFILNLQLMSSKFSPNQI
jgi:hypothetical protein